MPRSKTNPNEFVAGVLPIVTINGLHYYVDGRMEQLRNVNDFRDAIDTVAHVWTQLSDEDRAIVVYEYTGEVIGNY
jgi:hypothetical protein